MSEQYLQITQKDGHLSILHAYYCEGTPIASMVMLHGMAEHEGRYHEFAQYMNSMNYDFFIYNHRGHGPEADKLGHIADENGQNIVVEDAIHICNYVQENNRADKLVLMGHSFGSIVARNVIQHKDDFDAVIICGTAALDKMTTYASLAITKMISKAKGPGHYSELMNKLSFGSKDYKTVCTESELDWLSVNKENIARYRADHYSGFTCTVGFFHDMASLVLFGGQKEKIGRTRRTLPIFFIAGAMDPVGGLGKNVTSLYQTFVDLGFTNVSIKLYENDRHEILNEDDRAAVMQDITDWLAKVL